MLQRTGPFFITDRYLEFRRSHPEAAKSILHAPAADFSPIMDKNVVTEYTKFCKWRKGNRLKKHPLLIRGCNWLQRHAKELRRPNAVKLAVVKAYLVHRFLHLGYLAHQKIGLMRQFSVCDVVPTVSRYGTYDLNATIDD